MASATSLAPRQPSATNDGADSAFIIDNQRNACHSSIMTRVTLEPPADEQFLRLPTRIKNRVHGILERLQNWPAVSGAKPMRGGLAGRYRIRTGDYRVLFRVEKQEIVVERIGHRDGFYEE